MKQYDAYLTSDADQLALMFGKQRISRCDFDCLFSKTSLAIALSFRGRGRHAHTRKVFPNSVVRFKKGALSGSQIGVPDSRYRVPGIRDSPLRFPSRPLSRLEFSWDRVGPPFS